MIKLFSKFILFQLIITGSFSLITREKTININEYSKAIEKSVEYLENLQKKLLIPGIVSGVSINGTQVWTQAFGLTDVENNVKTRVDSVWRLASISKSMTSVLMGKLIDQGLVDMNKSIHSYLKTNVFPKKQWNGKDVDITVGQVMSHTAGLYVTKDPNEMFEKLIYNNVTETVIFWKDKPLLHAPGVAFNYSNYGYQVVGAIIESVLNETFESAINKMFVELGMNTTFCERRERIIPHRTRYYLNDNREHPNLQPKLINTGLGDDLISFVKYWAAGGIVSTVSDVLKFGSHLIKWSKGINTSKTCKFNF